MREKWIENDLREAKELFSIVKRTFHILLSLLRRTLVERDVTWLDSIDETAESAPVLPVIGEVLHVDALRVKMDARGERSGSGGERETNTAQKQYLRVQNGVTPFQKSLTGIRTILVLSDDLETKDQGPDETEEEFKLAVVNI